jgi:hypothetical protein
MVVFLCAAILLFFQQGLQHSFTRADRSRICTIPHDQPKARELLLRPFHLPRSEFVAFFPFTVLRRGRKVRNIPRCLTRYLTFREHLWNGADTHYHGTWPCGSFCQIAERQRRLPSFAPKQRSVSPSPRACRFSAAALLTLRPCLVAQFGRFLSRCDAPVLIVTIIFQRFQSLR